MKKAGIGEEKLVSYFLKQKAYRFKKGESIVRPDDEATALFYIADGFVRVYRITDWGDIKLQLIYKPTELFPNFWTFSDEPAVEFFEAIGDVTVYKAPKSALDEFLKANPDALYHLAQRSLEVHKITAERTDNLLFTDAYSRVIARLLHLAKRFGEKTTGKSVAILAPLSQKDIAFSIGMTRETASRCLSKLERGRFITYKDHCLIIRDIDKLKEELSTSHERRKL